MRVAVNLENDQTFGASTHNYSVPPLLMPAAPAPALEVIVAHKWEAGAAKHAFTSTVLHKGKTVVQDGHDAGQFIADMASFLPSYANGQRTLLMLGSARKISFSASTVCMNGKATGAAKRWSLPLMTCGTPASLPTCWPLESDTNSVHVGLTAGDVVFGWVGILASVATDVILFVMSLADPSQRVADAAKEIIGFDPKKAFINGGISLALGLARSYQNGWRTPVSAKVELGALGVGTSFEVTYDPKTNELHLGQGASFGSEKATTEAVYDFDDRSWKLVSDQNLVSTDP